MQKETNTYKVFTLKLARKLCDLGFIIVGTVPNSQKPWLNVYLFEDNTEIREAVQKYKEVPKDGRRKS